MCTSVRLPALLGVLLCSPAYAGFGPAPGIPRALARTPAQWVSSAPVASPPSPNFLLTSRLAPLGGQLRFPNELFSSARSNQRAPASRPNPGWGAATPAPRAPLPLRAGAAQPGPSPAQPQPLAGLRSLSPSRSVPAPAPTLLARAERTRTRGASSASPGRGWRLRAAGPPPASRGETPRPRRDPRLAVLPPDATPARTPPVLPPSRATRTRGHTWALLPGAGRARMGPR